MCVCVCVSNSNLVLSMTNIAATYTEASRAWSLSFFYCASCKLVGKKNEGDNIIDQRSKKIGITLHFLTKSVLLLLVLLVLLLVLVLVLVSEWVSV